MKTLSQTELLQLYNNSNDTGKNMLEEKYGKETFTSKDWIELFEIFCNEHNLVSADIIPYPTPKNRKQESINAHAMLIEIVPIENKGWEADWDKSDQRKWIPVFDMTSAGFGFSLTGYGSWSAFTDVGSRLCSQTESKCVEIAKKYLPIYEKYLKK